MASRFPTSVSPFPPLAMAESERDRLEYLAHRLVQKAIEEHDAHRQAGGNVDARSWKLVRKCDHLAMYKRTEPSGLYEPTQARQPATPIRSRAESVSVIENSITQGRPRQKMPVLLQVGSIQGTLNEVMYGAIAVDGPTMMLKTAYTEDTLLDAETLCQLRGPSAAHPFRFLGVKKVIRGQISSCILYIETSESPGGVDVFMKARFDPNGNVSETVATQSVALTLMYGAKVSVCAQNKKLSWLIRSSPDTSVRQRPARSMSMARQRSCPICSKSFNMFSGTAECEMCSTVICHACSAKKKLGFAKSGSKRVILHPVTFCTSCLTHARRLDDFDAARQEVLSGFGVDETPSATNKSRPDLTPNVHNCRRRDLRKMKTAPPTPSITKADSPEIARPHSERVMAKQIGTPPTRQRVNTWGTGDAVTSAHRWAELERQVAASGVGLESADEMEEFAEIKIHESSLVKVADPRDLRSVSFQVPHVASPERETAPEDFMARIIAMRNAAEDAYLTTRKTAQAQFEELTKNHNRTVRSNRNQATHTVR
ncbi:Zinc finger, RING/FYVE/PHD-type [Phytophthora cinnamomi]|uniref:Zinc finger, RING/FYVE/PHD-type n=1 Tax=Phytophthora cinnamomi TaxID=4785 RepID=UPI0035593EF9|nr:Zinc finger, RING/FYVE/PHD-type [Phytophthora cinnamomi]